MWAFVLLLLASCTKDTAELKLAASNSASQKNFLEKEYQTGFFKLFALEKITMPGSRVRVYIEGDGRAWLNRSTPSFNPTPHNSIMLRLALNDVSPNVIYLARPCQYIEDAKCEEKYWTTARFAPETVQSTLEVLGKYGNDIELVCYSGGAAISILAAAKNPAVKSLITIAGNLDHKAFTDTHEVTPLTGSAGMDGAIASLNNLPQIHYYGGEDEVITKAVIDSFKAKLGSAANSQFIQVPNATHQNGWEEYFKTHHLLGQ